MTGDLVSRLAGTGAQNFSTIPVTFSKLDCQTVAVDLRLIDFFFFLEFIQVKLRHLSDMDPQHHFPLLRLDSFYCF